MVEHQVVAIIPARGGSKGIPRKNLRRLAGMPLVVWAVQAGRAAQRVTRTVVSTDDDEIADVARSAGAEVIMRPAFLAEDSTPTMPVINHALDALARDGFEPEITVLIEPTSPFRTSAHIDSCVAKLSMGSTQSAVTVTQVERSPYNIFAVSGDDASRFVEAPTGGFSNRHELIQLKRVNGCVYATWTKNVRNGQLIVNPVKTVEMDAHRSVNIDTPLDLAFAELCVERFDLTSK